ncbi:uncharacterized protein LOC134492461 [Candoia aspera]|uniref:uncharacterized protein LOC134492454 n=1 Tax=Candoia aspera TaxID=51853 RepID=UPI002FD7C912
MQEVLDKICRLASPPSLGASQVVHRLQVVARKNLEMVTYRLLELPWSTCGELLWDIITSPYCSGDAVLFLLLAKEKEGPWPPQGEEQTTHPLPAATARAMRLIRRIVRSEECPVMLEAWFPEVLLCLVDTIITGTRQQNTSGQGGDHLPLEETVDTIQVLLARVAHLTLEESCREMLCRPSCCLQGVAMLVTALTETSPSATCSLQRHLSSVLEKEEAKEHSAAVVAFFVELLANYKSQAPMEKTWKLLMAWMEHRSQTMMSPEELCHAILGGLSSDSSTITLEFLGLAEQLGLQTEGEVWTPLNASLAAQYHSLFHHEAVTIRRAALKHIWPLLQHRKDLEGIAAIHTLIAVLMHVEDVEEEVAKAAKLTLRHLAQALHWHLGGTLLAGGTYSLQELLHKITKRLIRFPIPESQLEMEVFTCLWYFKSKQASVRRMAAMFIGIATFQPERHGPLQPFMESLACLGHGPSFSPGQA